VEIIVVFLINSNRINCLTIVARELLWDMGESYVTEVGVECGMGRRGSGELRRGEFRSKLLAEGNEMVIHWCQNCKYHETRESDLGRMSHCRKENCWARYSKCLNQHAMEYYLAHERVETVEHFSSVTHLYGQE
jgi:hypothetical protein